MRKSVGIVAAIALLLALVVGGMAWRAIRYGFNTRDEPTLAERWAARTLRHLAVPVTLREAKNPVPLTADVLANARAHWADHCASCHGNDGKGQTEVGQSLYPKAPDMTKEATQSLSDGELFAIIENGVRLTGMPAWGDGSDETERESWELAHLIRHLSDLTQAELREMESLNPVSAEEIAAERDIDEFLEECEPTAPTAAR